MSDIEVFLPYIYKVKQFILAMHASFDLGIIFTLLIAIVVVQTLSVLNDLFRIIIILLKNDNNMKKF